MNQLRNLWQKFKLTRDIRRLAGTRLLRAFSKSFPNAVFIQVGANDGEMMDPLRKTIESSNWQGFVLEPVPQLFYHLQANYNHLSGRVQAINVAIADQNGELPFYHLTDVEGMQALPPWAKGLGTFRKEVILNHADRIPAILDYLQVIKVSAWTWAELCRRLDIDQIDLLLTDTEGYDYEILRQVDFEQQAPSLVIYEHHHFDEATRQACIDLLNYHGYCLFEEGLDTWALQSRQCPPACDALVEQWQTWVDASPYARAVGSMQV